MIKDLLELCSTYVEHNIKPYYLSQGNHYFIQLINSVKSDSFLVEPHILTYRFCHYSLHTVISDVNHTKSAQDILHK